MKRMFLGLLVVTIGFAGCSSRRKEEPRKPDTQVYADVDIPTANGDMSVFDDGTNELMKAEQMVYDDMADQNLDLADAVYTNDMTYDDIAEVSNQKTAADDFSWIQESSDDFKKVYFEFDKYTLKEDQQEAISQNAEKVKEVLVATAPDKKLTLVIEGHADHAAGSDAYNLALSEKRAKTAKDHLVSRGVPSDVIKIVGRGSEVPALVDGKPVEGDRNQQWPNRRDEMRVIYS